MSMKVAFTLAAVGVVALSGAPLAQAIDVDYFNQGMAPMLVEVSSRAYNVPSAAPTKAEVKAAETKAAEKAVAASGSDKVDASNVAAVVKAVEKADEKLGVAPASVPAAAAAPAPAF